MRCRQEPPAIERVNDLLGYLQLELQRIRSFAVEASVPDLRLVTNKNELRSDSNVAPRGSQASLHDQSHTESPANLGDCFGRGLLIHRGRAGDDAKTIGIEACNLKYDFLGQSVAQQIELRVIPEIDKRQNLKPLLPGGQFRSRDVRSRQRHPGLQPGIELLGLGVNRGASLVEMAVDGKAFAAFPALDGADSTVQVFGDRLPGDQAIHARGGATW